MAITTNQRNAASTSAVDKAAYAPTSTETVRNILLAYIAENGGVDLTAPGAIGGTTPGTGAFTTLAASSTLAVTGASTMAAITSTKLAIGTTPADGVLITNTTDASAGTPVQYSPAFSLSGTGWATDSTSSIPVKFREYVVPAQGTTAPTGTLTWDSIVSTAPAVTRMTLSTSGNLGVTSLTLGTSGILNGGTNLIEQRNGTSAQTFRAYNTYTDASNYERATFGYTSNILQIGTEKAGTGTARAINFVVGGTAAWEYSVAGNFRPLIDNTFDIGASGATRPKNLFVAGNGTFGGTLGYGGTGAGGTVTQITSRTTAVTINKACGTITTDTSSLSAIASASFTVNNSTVAISDVIILNIRSGQTNKKTKANVTAVAAGSFEITIDNLDAVTAEVGAIVVNFSVIKAVTS